MAAPVVTHDQLGRYAIEFLAAAPSCGLPSGAAFLAFVKAKGLTVMTARALRAVVRVVEAA